MAQGLPGHALVIPEPLVYRGLHSRLIDVFELLGGVLQMATEIFALSNDVLSGSAPLLVQLLKALAADALPVTFELTCIALNLGLNLVLNLVVELDEDLAKLAHQVGIDMNSSHSSELSSFCYER